MTENAWDIAKELVERQLERLKNATATEQQLPEYWQAWCDLFCAIADLERLLDKQDAERVSQINRANAKQKRRKRGLSPENLLRLRALQCVLYEFPHITAETLIDRIDADERLTYDDDDVEISLSGDSLRIRDLASHPPIEETKIKKSSLRKYLSDARNT